MKNKIKNILLHIKYQHKATSKTYVKFKANTPIFKNYNEILKFCLSDEI